DGSTRISSRERRKTSRTARRDPRYRRPSICRSAAGVLNRVIVAARMRPLRLDDARLRRMSALSNQFAPRGAPSLGSPFDASHVRDATLAEELSGPERTEAALANHEDRTIAGNLIEPGREIGLRQIDGTRNVPTRKLFRLAHVDDGCI